MAIGNIEHLKNDLQESQLGPDLPPHREEGRWISGYLDMSGTPVIVAISTIHIGLKWTSLRVQH